MRSNRLLIPAPPRLRAAAWLIDLLIVVLPTLTYVRLTDTDLPPWAAPSPFWQEVLLSVLTLIAYHAVLVRLRGQTFGKALFDLHVTRAGKRPGIIWSTGRALGYVFVDVLGLGSAWALIDQRHRCFHDLAFQSEVVLAGDFPFTGHVLGNRLRRFVRGSATLGRQADRQEGVRHGTTRRIFISYRRHDAPGHAGRLYDGLASRFGVENIFMDVDSIRPGDDFFDVLEATLSQIDLMVVVVGPRWIGITDESGRRRLDDPDDFVRTEISHALARSDVTVIPVRVAGAGVPRRHDLPESLQALARRQATELSDDHWGSDFARLVSEIEGAVNTA